MKFASLGCQLAFWLAIIWTVESSSSSSGSSSSDDEGGKSLFSGKKKKWNKHGGDLQSEYFAHLEKIRKARQERIDRGQTSLPPIPPSTEATPSVVDIPTTNSNLSLPKPEESLTNNPSGELNKDGFNKVPIPPVDDNFDAGIVKPHPKPSIRVSENNPDKIIVQINNEAYECDRWCPHKGADLSRGHLSGSKLVCPRHKWEFSVSDCNGCKVVDW